MLKAYGGKARTKLRWLWLAALLLLLDQLTKHWALAVLMPYQPLEVWPFFNLMLAFNPGAAFSFLSDAGGWQQYIFSGIALVVSFILFVWLRRLQRHETLLAIALVSILAGAIGNLIDRLYWGHVIDFIQLHVGPYYWPTFNIADTVICIGAVLMAVDVFKKPKSAPQSSRST